MSDTITKKAKILREFNDAGTEKRYFAGKEHDFPAGEFANYLAAGLVEEVAEPVVATPADTDAGKSSRPRA